MLAYVGVVVPQELLSIMVLSCLPEEFENFRVAIESRDDIPEVSVIKAKLIKEDARRQSNVNTGENSAALYSRTPSTNKKEIHAKNTNNGKFLGKCFKCGKVGHRASVCKTKLPQNKANRADTSEKSNSENENVLIATTAMACEVEKEE
ncbi:uncharacterized protein [Temnothorax longispinosus]|uniref:uncharacterized protein n=1 Tax=Temnothorax longispinosus TaxID=300112 RepID=UPI003A994D28